MKPINELLITPKEGNRYDNQSRLGDGKLIVNTSIESHTHVNRVGIVEETPIDYEGPIRVGDEVILHHNVFRIYYDMKGDEQSGPCHFFNDFYLVPEDQIYFYASNKDEWKSTGEYCFIEPIEKKQGDVLTLEKNEELKGKITHDNKYLNNIGIFNGNIVSFHPDVEYEFRVEDKILYRVKNERVCMTLTK